MNEVAFVMLVGLFGWQVALLYLASGIIIGVVAGMILGRMKLEKYVEPMVYAIKARPTTDSPMLEQSLTWADRFERAITSTREIIAKVWLFVIIGIGIGAFIHGFVPEEASTSIMGQEAWWSVPIAVLLGIPLYSNAAGVIPDYQRLIGQRGSTWHSIGVYDGGSCIEPARNYYFAPCIKTTSDCDFCGCGRYRYYAHRLFVQLAGRINTLLDKILNSPMLLIRHISNQRYFYG